MKRWRNRSFWVRRGFAAAILVKSEYMQLSQQRNCLMPCPVSKSRTSKHMQVGQTYVQVPHPKQVWERSSQSLALNTFIMLLPANFARSRCTNGSFSVFARIASCWAETALSSLWVKENDAGEDAFALFC